jgi:predicted outer membrane repeat protein
MNSGDCTGCMVTFNGTNTFKDNYAAVQGGAISFASNNYTVDSKNGHLIMNNNTAGILNYAISSYSESVEITFPPINNSKGSNAS